MFKKLLVVSLLISSTVRAEYQLDNLNVPALVVDLQDRENRDKAGSKFTEECTNAATVGAILGTLVKVGKNYMESKNLDLSNNALIALAWIGGCRIYLIALHKVCNKLEDAGYIGRNKYREDFKLVRT